MASNLTPPHNRGMTVLDREAFKAEWTTLAICSPSTAVKQLTTALEDKLLNVSRIKSVVPVNNNAEKKYILLNLDIKDIKEALNDTQLELIKDYDIVPYRFQVDYDYWTTEQVLYSVMPEGDAETPSSFTTTGHIAHVNLKPENIPFKSLIAQVILDKNKKIKSVVNKTNEIDNTYRNFQMELLAGKDDMITELIVESNTSFPFRKKMSAVLNLIFPKYIGIRDYKQNIAGDVMAGVGPFSIPAVKKGAIVYANDLNPSSYQWLCENIELNKITSNISTYNMDGRAFIKKAVKDLYLESNGTKFFQHFVMNLPATAIEFLDAFKGIYKGINISSDLLPMIHVHCFTRSADPIQDIKQRVCQIMGGPIDAAFCNMQMYHVRTVAPKKDMYCVSFRLGPEVAF
ncbi:hypothetical protein MFLAVUS_004752 [Mucor flavus]|uniref:tRNA (guanine(37)-N1)-methyltransferase n=1 Tax=Mucor flavus TaxID=439312 RepID=A0ABP9YWT0_9FUNG